MFCTKCGSDLKEGAAFCTSCGEPVKKPASAEVSVEEMPVAEPQVEVETAPAVEAQPVVEPVYVYNSQPENSDAENNGSVGFIEAIKLLFTNYANFTGKASRSEFWWAYLFIGIASLLSFIPVLGYIISLGLVVPNLSLSVRRLRDVGRHWSYIFMGFIPFAGAIILIINFCKPTNSIKN